MINSENAIILPAIVNGKEYYAPIEECHHLKYETGQEVYIPIVTDKIKSEVLNQDKGVINRLHTDDITFYLSKIGEYWGNPESELVGESVKLASKITGYSQNILFEDYVRIARSMSRAKLYDIIDGDIGNSLLLDDWVPRQSVYMKAIPKGRVLHLMVGNVPLAGLFTLVRGILTKNLTIAKLPSRDPISCLFFARAFIKVAPDHPITRSISVLYWPGGEPIESEFISNSNIVCAWGQGSSISSIKKNVPLNVGFAEFGPKESIHIVALPYGDLDSLTTRIAYDVSVYEQEACFSPQKLFIEGSREQIAQFCESLSKNMNNIMLRLPNSFKSKDKLAHFVQTKLEARFLGWNIIEEENNNWRIVVADSVEDLDKIESPLGRTIFVIPVPDIKDSVKYLHGESQTVGIHPLSKAAEIADDLALAGALRITEIGLMSRPRPGFSHDGMLPLHDLVKWISLERGLDYKGRFRDSDKNDFEKKLFRAGKF